ncbi:hypothetical protein PE066_12315 [Ramlibacter tataouinensis]|uniref:hypothetical protein n=1 Tax=Ramlibacter tataouinensis TaxID=94132 RepID=UPI0022F3BE3E|nr:hypothetical protein [Ramlibacter tataouinensis]WBY00261.1 hypothetical protein PE066_12315 [Ramlibacter tataouinensis]
MRRYGSGTGGAALNARIRPAALLLLLAAAPLAQADAPAPDLTGSVGLMHRRLTERNALGGKLLTETGPMLQVQLEATRPLPDGAALAARAHLAAGDIDYDGRTQGGVPLATTTRQYEGGVDVLWRPHEPAAWGEAWLSLGWLANRRLIRGTPIAGGLDELSSATLAGVRWRSPAFTPAAGWTSRVEVEARTSLSHQLRVDYYGLLDRSRFEGARKQLWTLRLQAAPTDSPWQWGLEWSLLRQPASKAVPVSRGGMLLPGTTVRQPELTSSDLVLRVGRRF